MFVFGVVLVTWMFVFELLFGLIVLVLCVSLLLVGLVC